MRKRGTGQRELQTDGFSVEPAGVRHFLIWGDKWISVTKKSVSHTSDHACPMRSVYGWGGGRKLTVSTLSFPFSTFLPFPLLHPLLLCQFLFLFSPSFPSPFLKSILLKLCVCMRVYWEYVLMSPANHRGQKGWRISWSWTHRQLWASHCQWLGQNSGILQEQDTFSTAEPTLQLLPKLTLD